MRERLTPAPPHHTLLGEVVSTKSARLLGAARRDGRRRGLLQAPRGLRKNGPVVGQCFAAELARAALLEVLEAARGARALRRPHLFFTTAEGLVLVVLEVLACVEINQ